VPHAQVSTALTDRLLAKSVTVAAVPTDDDPSVISIFSILANWAPYLLSCAVFFGGLWIVMARPVLALTRQLEAYIKITEQRSSERPPLMS
jgi:hypothetical protein